MTAHDDAGLSNRMLLQATVGLIVVNWYYNADESHVLQRLRENSAGSDRSRELRFAQSVTDVLLSRPFGIFAQRRRTN